MAGRCFGVWLSEHRGDGDLDAEVKLDPDDAEAREGGGEGHPGSASNPGLHR